MRDDPVLSFPQMFSRLEWMEKGLCRKLADAESDPQKKIAIMNAWFAGNNRGRVGGPSKEATEARLLCWECPVRQNCYDYAVEFKPEDGIWGGFTAQDILKLSKREVDR